jgi:hypothetical protein
MYDPKTDHLAERDASFLTALRDKFLRALLGKVGPNSVRGHLIGKILAEAERRGISWHAVLARQLPATIEVARQITPMSRADLQAIDYSRQHAGEYITRMADDTMGAVRQQIAAALEAKTSPQELSRQLFDRFGEANMDWRRIALTETAIAVSNGYLASLPEWTIVVGDSSHDACDWCREHIHNRAFRSLPEPPVPANGENYSAEQSANYVWVGKTNVGRSRHPTTRDGVARKPHELWHPCFPAHPHCRCRPRRLIESVETIQPGTNRVVQKNALGAAQQ